MKTLNRRLGRLAEDFAANALEEKGFKILERNFANRFGEIDIIAQESETIVFIEVKAKTGEDFGLPEEMVNFSKLSRVKRMALIYLNGSEALCRIDVVAIVFSQNNQLLRLTHYENVY